ncbi:uncharacterized protein LOC143373405 isoform X2 [Andrena cerasifolii]|uniref:uncharacterized protein LOC143373405 isoform X2 n=1 Tax=Andrena cerasifolii TaxID=2819439 RepID=UPI0040382E68
MVLSILLLLIFLCSAASALKNDRGGSSFRSGPNFTQRSRRIALNEYLVPPPPPRHQPVRSGRVANPQSTEGPGYFSKFMNWLNPFGFAAPSHPLLKSPPYLETPFPPTQQTHVLPFNAHPPAEPGASLHSPLGPQPGLPLYPPLAPPPGQHSSFLLTPPVPPHPIPPLNAPPNPAFPIYSPPPAPSSHQQFLPPAKNNRDPHPPSNKGKPCNPCNKVPWIPMQGGGVHSDVPYPLSPQPQNGYLPPSNQGNHDAQHAASHEIRIPDYSQLKVEQNGQGLVSPLPDPLLYPGPIPPLYKPISFDRPPQNFHTDIAEHLEPPSLPAAPSIDQGHKDPEISGQFSIRDNHDLTSSGTQINQGHVNVLPQNQGADIDEGLADHKGSFGTSILDEQTPLSGPSHEQKYHDPSVPKQEHGGGLNQPVQSNQNTVASFGSSSIDNHGFTSQGADGYHESFVPNSGNNGGLNYLPPDLNPSASFGSSAFNNQDAESSNYQYSEDLSPSSSIVKNSHATAQTPPAIDSPTKDDSIHFEESPLLDLTKKSESRTDAQWSPPTTTFVDADTTFDSTLKTTTNYNLQTDDPLFEDTSGFNGPTESYSSSNVQNNIFGSSTPSTVDVLNNDNRYVETSTISTQYTNQQGVSYIPPSGQLGFLWPSLLNTRNSKNESRSNGAFLDSLAGWNNSSKDIKNSDQQGTRNPMNASNKLERQQNVKRNKQVQVIIPYTSDYTPIPFQQSYGDWSVRNNVERSEARKVPHPSNTNIDNYLQQESRNEIRLINQLQSQFNFNASKRTNGESVRLSLVATENDSIKQSTIKANNSIDVRRLQKNIDNWTIQEYSKPTMSSTIQPSSPHPYLMPSKKIPTEYLTTTEPGDHANESNDNIESVKTYSLAGFSFNEVEHEGSASNDIEATQASIEVARVESSKSISSALESTSIPATKEKSTWDGYSVSISPVNKERVYVVTPQPITATSPKIDFEKQKREKSQQSPAMDEQKGDSSLSEFEAIEKAYQVLPQAVNNLAVASTGKEDIPLWGIMEHEEFASLNLDDTEDEASEDVVDGPVLYSGHSKVSRAKR